MDLFTHAYEQRMKSEAPLAVRMRPRTLDEFVEQKEILMAELHVVIDAAMERRKMYQKKTILFVKDVRESFN